MTTSWERVLAMQVLRGMLCGSLGQGTGSMGASPYHIHRRPSYMYAGLRGNVLCALNTASAARLLVHASRAHMRVGAGKPYLIASSLQYATRLLVPRYRYAK